jgi:hypothetical protein
VDRSAWRLADRCLGPAPPPAFFLPAGPLAGISTLPWLACAFVGVAAGLLHGLAALASTRSAGRLPDLGIDVALGFWGVGAAFAFLERLGVDAGFGTAIVMLTATHFHFAGFGLLAVATLLATWRRWLWAAAVGLTVGIPLTALGFILRSNLVNAAGAAIVGISGIGVGLALLAARVTAPSDWLFRIAGLSLLVAMPMGIAWAYSLLVGPSFVDLDTMIRTHGVLNALALLLAVVGYRPAR